MRIIAGRWGGRRLVTPKHDRTRPTPDRVREALFSILGPVEGDRVLDAFAGSGALGLEALSRGAAEVDFVERDSGALAALESNVEALGAERARVHRGNVLTLLERGRLIGPYDLVFLDPPYQSALWARATGALDTSGVLSDSARVINEHPTEVSLEAPHGLALETQRSYGDVAITIFAIEGERA